MMHLVAYLKTGPTSVHVGGWRHPESQIDNLFEPSRYQQIAQELEAACVDACFFADLLGLYDIHKDSFDSYVKYGGQISYLDPMTVLPLMAAATSHLGLGATLSTTFFNAYHLARSLNSLDVLSKGRVAWNVVTSATNLEAQNFGFDSILPREQRYDHADEVLEACCALWDCWQESALVMDTASVFRNLLDVQWVRNDLGENRWIISDISKDPMAAGHTAVWSCHRYGVPRMGDSRAPS